MKEAYVTFEVAKLLKEKSFDWEVRTYYNEDGDELRLHDDFSDMSNSEIDTCDPDYIDYLDIHCTRPTQQMAMRWLRENYDIMIIPNRDKIVDVAPEPFYDYYCIIRHNGNEYWISSLDLPDAQHYTEYEDVVEAALQYCLTNLI